MRFTRRSRSGFSLTEILMAVGILGVGMTMVASIFPVAVDQTRRANDTTMAALCARSAAAVMRARRSHFVNTHREYFKALMLSADAGKITDRERPAEFGIYADPTITDSKRNPGVSGATANAIISRDMLVYNPNLFLYEAAKRYDVYAPKTAPTITTDPYWPQWNAGNYVPVLYVTPIVPTDKRTDAAVATQSTTPGNYNTDTGPYRVTIVVFKSRGALQDTTITPYGDRLHPRTKTWSQNAKNTTAGEPTFVAGPGDYIIDRTRHCGEAYLIDFANLGTTTIAGQPGSATEPPILLACGVPAESGRWKCAPNNLGAATDGTRNWYPLPGVVGVFHTVIGD